MTADRAALVEKVAEMLSYWERPSIAGAIALIRAEVLEEAAKAIDEMPLSYPGNAAETALECAAAIRALKQGDK